MPLPLLALLLNSPLRQEHTIVVEGYRPPSDAAVAISAIKYLPFQVPPGCTVIRIHKEFDHGPDPAAKSTVDFGLFDPRGYGPGGPGFRGWQGGVAEDAVITGDPATTGPWFLAGPLPAGTWYIAQSFLKSTPSGLKYRYLVTFSFDGPKPPARMPRVPRYSPGVLSDKAGWYAGNLHVHSIHSDGGRTFPDLARYCSDAGFDFLVSTEHNSTTSHYRFAETGKAVPKLLLIEGDEFTSPSGHAGILGSKPGHWFDFRFDGGQGRLPGVIEAAKKDEAVFVVNHPFAPCTSCQWRYPDIEWVDANGIEVWNGAWDITDQMAVNLWEKRLANGERLNAYGGTDYHRGNDPLSPATMVFARSLSRAEILKGLHAGATVLCLTPRGPTMEATLDGERPGTILRPALSSHLEVKVAVRENAVLVVRSDKGIVNRTPVSGSGSVRVELDTLRSHFVRLELRKDSATGPMLALTNAFFMSSRKNAL